MVRIWILFEYRKIRTEKTPHLDTLHAVFMILSVFFKISRKASQGNDEVKLVRGFHKSHQLVHKNKMLVFEKVTDIHIESKIENKKNCKRDFFFFLIRLLLMIQHRKTAGQLKEAVLQILSGAKYKRTLQGEGKLKKFKIQKSIGRNASILSACF